MEGEQGFRERWRQSRPREFWRTIAEGLTLQELWAQFQKEATASYRVYAKSLPRTADEEPRGHRWLRTARALFWAIVARLSPARRLFLLAALLFLLWGLLSGSPPWALPLAALMLLFLLALELADRVAMKRDLEIARDIQRWLLPKEPPVVPGVEIAFTTRAANTVAGDYYDAFLRGDGGSAPAGRPGLLLVVADVAGKSMPAALLMATFQASLRTVAHESTDLPELVRRINLYACEHSLDGRRFTTAVFAELDPATGVLSYVNAGHNPPLVRRADGALVRLEAGGLPLGIREDLRYESQTLALGREDALVIYTDGIVEAENEQREQYGEIRLEGVVRLPAPGGAAEWLERILSSVASFVGTAPQQDDITCLVMRYRGA